MRFPPVVIRNQQVVRSIRIAGSNFPEKIFGSHSAIVLRLARGHTGVTRRRRLSPAAPW
jgi:hypothetical protein